MLFTKEIILVILFPIEKVNDILKKIIHSFDVLFVDITQAMLTQDPQGLRDSIARVKSSPHAEALADEIRQAEGLLSRLK